MKCLILILILYIENAEADAQEDYLSTQRILNITADIIKDTNQRIDVLEDIKRKSSNNAPFEIGYLIYTIQEKFRRMVDKYNTSHYMRQKLYLIELVLYLEEIERHYWEIDHISKMLHEVERKYKIRSNLADQYIDNVEYPTIESSSFAYQSIAWPTRTTRKKKKMKMDKYIINKFFKTKKKKKRWWPIEYGWEIDYYW